MWIRFFFFLVISIATFTSPVNSFHPPSYRSLSSFPLASSKATPSSSMESSPTTQQQSQFREYSEQELKDALYEFYGTDGGCDHLYGYHDRATHTLSKLQTITATVLLDDQYETAADDETTSTTRTINNLHAVIQASFPRMALAAEFKRASPSKGAIAMHLNVAEQACAYVSAGACILSVLTEPRWFQGSLEDIRAMRAVVPAHTVILRKDFIVSERMIAQAADAGADTVLLIVAVLAAPVLERLLTYARHVQGMEPLVEVHTRQELLVALHVGATVIGVNNRNLHTFQMDLHTTEHMATLLTDMEYAFQPPSNTLSLCALSGMSTALDVDRYRQAGVSMCLIGESLMRAADPVLAIQGLGLDPRVAGSTQDSGSGGAYTTGTQCIKVCGMTQPEDALVACQAGANMIGIIFAAGSKRKVTSVEQAQAIVQTVRQFGERQETIDFGLPTTTTTSSTLSDLRKSTQAIGRTVQQKPAVVGVFQNQEPEYIRSMVQECGLDMVQLHGQEGMEAARFDNYGVPVIRVVDIAVEEDNDADTPPKTAVETILQSLTSDPAMILLDTSIKGTGGGTGKAFDWSIAEGLQNAGLPVFIAGGLNPESVTECVTTSRPFGVDVSSGVEKSAGVKDHDKIQTFLRDARQAAAKAAQGF